ncbi:MAG: tRNA-dependent cyclodipeptide synthase [Gammaproteobacteria bacterium]|nr:tRNA-dependent cyclodipeptide synthase [Gammaproteobacteria bacterium]
MNHQKNGNLKASFRHNPPGHQFIYPYASAVLLISVGQKYHEGEIFAATIDLINRSNFKNVAIIIGDSNQKYNLRINSDEKLSMLHEKAVALGTQWLNNNRKYYSQLTVPYNIIRWDEWVQHDDYEKHRNTVNKLYNDHESIRNAAHNAIYDFIQRNIKQGVLHEAKIEHAHKHCLEYLLEECSIIIPLWTQEKFDFIIYPSKMLDVLKEVHEKIVKPFSPNAVNWLSLRFKRLAMESE